MIIDKKHWITVPGDRQPIQVFPDPDGRVGLVIKLHPAQGRKSPVVKLKQGDRILREWRHWKRPGEATAFYHELLAWHMNDPSFVGISRTSADRDLLQVDDVDWERLPESELDLVTAPD